MLVSQKKGQQNGGLTDPIADLERGGYWAPRRKLGSYPKTNLIQQAIVYQAFRTVPDT